MIAVPLIAVLRKLHHRVLTSPRPARGTIPAEEEEIRRLNDLLHATTYPINPSVKDLASQYLDALADLLFTRLSGLPQARDHERKTLDRAQKLLLSLEVAGTTARDLIPATELLEFSDECLREAAIHAIPPDHRAPKSALFEDRPGPGTCRLSDILILLLLFYDQPEGAELAEKNARLIEETLIASGRVNLRDSNFHYALDLTQHVVHCILGRVPPEQNYMTAAIAIIRKRFDDQYGFDRIPCEWTEDTILLTGDSARYFLAIAAGKGSEEPPQARDRETGDDLGTRPLPLSTVLFVLLGRRTDPESQQDASRLEEVFIKPRRGSTENRKLQDLLRHTQRIVDSILGKIPPDRKDEMGSMAVIEDLEDELRLDRIPIPSPTGPLLLEEEAEGYLRAAVGAQTKNS